MKTPSLAAAALLALATLAPAADPYDQILPRVVGGDDAHQILQERQPQFGRMTHGEIGKQGGENDDRRHQQDAGQGDMSPCQHQGLGGCHAVRDKTNMHALLPCRYYPMRPRRTLRSLEDCLLADTGMTRPCR